MFSGRKWYDDGEDASLRNSLRTEWDNQVAASDPMLSLIEGAVEAAPPETSLRKLAALADLGDATDLEALFHMGQLKLEGTPLEHNGPVLLFEDEEAEEEVGSLPAGKEEKLNYWSSDSLMGLSPVAAVPSPPPSPPLPSPAPAAQSSPLPPSPAPPSPAPPSPAPPSPAPPSPPSPSSDISAPPCSLSPALSTWRSSAPLSPPASPFDGEWSSVGEPMASICPLDDPSALQGLLPDSTLPVGSLHLAPAALPAAPPAEPVRLAVQPAEPVRLAVQPAEPVQLAVQPAEPVQLAVQPSLMPTILVMVLAPPEEVRFSLPDTPESMMMDSDSECSLGSWTTVSCASPASPTFQPQAAPAFQPQAARAFEPQAAPAFQPQAAPAFQPQAAPAFQPQAARAFQPQAARAFEPQAARAFQPQAARAFQPQAAPAFQPQAARAIQLQATPAFQPQAARALQLQPFSASKASQTTDYPRRRKRAPKVHEDYQVRRKRGPKAADDNTYSPGRPRSRLTYDKRPQLRTGQCHICLKVFARLDKHLMVHRGDKPHACTMCSKRFRQSEHLRRHVASRHGMKRRYPCEVEGCDKVLSRKDKLAEHQAHVHDKERGANSRRKKAE